MAHESDPLNRSARARAIADGILIDVSGAARVAGIRLPVAVTRRVWEQYVAGPPVVVTEDEAGRLADLLHLLQLALPGAAEPVLLFSLFNRAPNGLVEPGTAKAVCEPGDRAEPVLTVMLPEEG